jgi:alpha,alpha-trehalase
VYCCQSLVLKKRVMQFCIFVISSILILFFPLISTRPAEIQNAQDVEPGEIVQVCDETNSKNWFIYCSGRMIEAAMTLHLYADSKTYTDRPLLRPPGDVLKDFNEQFPEGQEIKKEELQAFMDKNFAAKDDELDRCELTDWTENPPLIDTIRDESMKKWALNLHGIWKDLCRKIKKEVNQKPDQFSLLYVPNQFVVPGGRFKEYYYWDAYWIIKGLLASGMVQTVKDMIYNLVYLVENHGFIPNGGRVYYLRRSQPPFLIPMVYDYFEATGDIAFVNEILPTLEKELNFWYENRQTNVSLIGEEVQVFRYNSASNVPRPESYREDMLLVQNINDTTEKRKIWSNLASAAESGWDFSSRWFKDLHNLSSIDTSNVIPVDLNAFMCGNLNILSFLFEKSGTTSKAEKYRQKFENFKRVFQKVFYVENEKGWYDYNLRNASHNINFYPSMLTPLFTNCYHSLDVSTVEDMFEHMDKQGAFKYKGGVPSR